MDGTVQVLERRMLDAQNAEQVESEEGHPAVRFSYDEDALGGIFQKSPALNLRISSIPLQVRRMLSPHSLTERGRLFPLTTKRTPIRRKAINAHLVVPLIVLLGVQSEVAGKWGWSSNVLHSAHCALQLPPKLTNRLPEARVDRCTRRSWWETMSWRFTAPSPHRRCTMAWRRRLPPRCPSWTCAPSTTGACSPARNPPSFTSVTAAVGVWNSLHVACPHGSYNGALR